VLAVCQSTLCKLRGKRFTNLLKHKKRVLTLPELSLMSLPRYVGELPQLGDHCDCVPEWHCNPHDACFIHDSCFCDGSGSWPPIKPYVPIGIVILLTGRQI